VKRTRRGESTGTVMGTTEETPCVAIFISNLQKYYVSLIIFLCFLFYKIGEQEGKKVLSEGEVGGLHWWEGGGGRKRGRRMNTVETMYTHVCKCKTDTC
jgi:hypothetical protein